jgi:hypothetical protein
MMRAGVVGALAIAGASVVVASVVLAVTVPVPAAAAATISVPASIDATGATDVSRALDEFFATVPAGATVTFPAGGRFRVESVLRIQGARAVTIEGNGAEIFALTTGADIESPGGRFRTRWPRLREHVSIHDASGLTIRDLTIRGPNDEGRFVPALEGQAGVAIYRSADVVLENLRVEATHGDGVYVAGKTTGVRVMKSSLHTIGRQGIAIVNASDIVVEQSRFDVVARSVFDLEPAVPRWAVDRVHLRENEVGEYRNFLLAAGGAGPGVNDVWLERNHVTGGNGIAVFAGMPKWLRRGLHVLGNTSAVPGRNVAGEQREGVMQIARIEGVEIRDNQMAVANGPAITLAGVCDAEVRDNDFPGATRDVVESGACDRTPASVPGGRPRATAEPGSGAGATTRETTGETSGRARPPRVPDTVGGADWLVVGGLAVVAAVAVLWLRRTRRGPKPSE